MAEIIRALEEDGEEMSEGEMGEVSVEVSEKVGEAESEKEKKNQMLCVAPMNSEARICAPDIQARLRNINNRCIVRSAQELGIRVQTEVAMDGCGIYYFSLQFKNQINKIAHCSYCCLIDAVFSDPSLNLLV